jgi:hypothetical protein
MFRVAVLLLIAATSSLWIAGTVAEAKGPPDHVTISGGDLRSEVVIARSDLVPVDQTGYFDSNGTPYARAPGITGEIAYHVSVYTIEPSSNDPQLFLTLDYFPANGNHPSLLVQDGALWRTQPAFSGLLDAHIASALTVAMPSTGGPPARGRTEIWEYALLALGMTLIGGSGLAFALARKR